MNYPLFLLYIGKSNKKFTHKKVYHFIGSPSIINRVLEEKDDLFTTGSFFTITIYANNSRKINFFNQHVDYFINNFKIIDEQGVKKLERKRKLQKLSK